VFSAVLVDKIIKSAVCLTRYNMSLISFCFINKLIFFVAAQD